MANVKRKENEYFVYARHHKMPRFEWRLFGGYGIAKNLLKGFLSAQKEYGNRNVIVSSKDVGPLKVCSVFKGVEMLEVEQHYIDVFRFVINFTSWELDGNG